MIELKFYTSKFTKVKHLPLEEWLLEVAQKLGVTHGSSFKAVAGFNQTGELLEEHFFESGSDAPMQVHLLVDAAQEKELLAHIKKKGIKIDYSRIERELHST